MVKQNSLFFLTLMFFAGELFGQATPPAPYGPLPGTNQLQWHEVDMYALVCFGLNTYTDKEWGYGDTDPALFNPSAFDATQITGVLKEAGFKGVVLVAKHHDGFCLWPTKTTKYSVAASPWMEGKGDVVKSFEIATRKTGLKFGLYNSPWDRNSALYGTPSYLPLYQEQLEELNKNYGPLFISWYDGANGGDGYYGGAKRKREIDRAIYYKWDETWGIIRKLQPQAVIFSDIGPDVRWVGNESGFAGETSWATFTPKGKKDINKPSPGDCLYAESSSGSRDGKFWIPAECDVPLRPGWYYHPSEDNQVKSPYELFDIYFKSVGRGASFDLGVAPDRRGILHENDVKALKGFGKLLKQTFSSDLLRGSMIQASNIRGGVTGKYGPKNLLDNNKETYWATDDDITTPEFTIRLKGITRFNIIRLREYIPLGQRIEAFAVDIWKNNSWQEITKGTSIGAQRLIRLPYFVNSDRIRVRILQSPVSPVLNEFAVFAEPEPLGTSGNKIGRDDLQQVNKKDWKVLSAPGKEDAAVLFDNKSTIWEGPFNHSNLSENAILIDMGKQQEISGLIFIPPAEAFSNGIIDKYQVLISGDGIKWQEASAGELGNIWANPLKQLIPFSQKTKGRYIKFVPLHIADEGDLIRITEIGAY